MFVQAYIHTALEILKLYKGEEPFATFLKKFFSAHKKFGSRDRKQIASLCYCFFRLGKSLPGMEFQERILVALFLCSKEQNPVLKTLQPQWNEAVTENLLNKINRIERNFNFQVEDILSLKEDVSPEIDYSLLAQSFLIQPNTFLRIRPGNESVVKKNLTDAGIAFWEMNPHCLALAPSTKIDEVLL